MRLSEMSSLGLVDPDLVGLVSIPRGRDIKTCAERLCLQAQERPQEEPARPPLSLGLPLLFKLSRLS
jgi:hypothetical protein